MIEIRKLPGVLETYFVEEARSIPSAYWGAATTGTGFLGNRIRRMSGQGIMAGWALTVSCPGDNNLAAFLALQYMRDAATQGHWIMVVTSEDEPVNAAMWSYMHSALAWEVGFVGAVVAGYVRDIDETRTKLRKEFSLFAYGGSPIPSTRSAEGEIGSPVDVNGVTIRTGDLIVGDEDGVICVPKDQVETAAEKCRHSIIDEVNRLQHVREGRGSVDVMDLRDMLTGNVEIVE